MAVSKHLHSCLMQQAALGTPGDCGKPTGRTDRAQACIDAEHQSHDKRKDGLHGCKMWVQVECRGGIRDGLPVPGGPTSSTPAGERAPRSVNFLGFFRNCTSSMISALTWSMPAMSAKVMRESLLVIISRRAPPNSLCNATMLMHLLKF